MGFAELILLGVGVSMDAFAVSVCKGLSMPRASKKAMATCGAWFGGFQVLMPLIGFLLGNLFYSAISSFDHWIAFILLAAIGYNMIKESRELVCKDSSSDLSFKVMFPMAIATSIDALAIGISLAMVGNINIWLAITIIGTTTFIFSAIGVNIGNVFGDKFEKKAEFVGGVILILLGLKILLEHLGVI